MRSQITTRGFGPTIRLALGCLLLLGCPRDANSPNGQASQDPEKLSRAEYDVARDEWQRGRLRPALEHAHKASTIDESFAEAHHFVSILYLAICQTEGDCRYAEAETFVRKALAADPESRDARHTLGLILLHQKRYDDAIAVLKLLAEDLMYRTPELAWYDLGGAYLEKGEFDRASDALTRALALKPTYCWANYRLGLVLEKKGDGAKAEQAFAAAVEQPDPACRNLQDAYLARGRIRAKLGKKADACTDFDTCIRLATDSRLPQPLTTGKTCSRLRKEVPC